MTDAPKGTGDAAVRLILAAIPCTESGDSAPLRQATADVLEHLTTRERRVLVSRLAFIAAEYAKRTPREQRDEELELFRELGK